VLASDEALPLGLCDGVLVERAPAGADVSRLLIDGEVDAMILPHPPAVVLAARAQVRPLFHERKAEALGYYQRHGYYPIMRLIAFRRPVIEAHPWLARAIMGMWEAKAQSRELYDDPGYAQLVFARNDLEAQDAAMDLDPWPSGLAANRHNLEPLVRYSLDQRLIEKPVSVEQMFHKSTWDS
jgi:4,5-dihydroxyphthalate decarboxylase